MLRELHISNLAVIEDAVIELDAGLNVFTGQTGAGKSLIIGAFEVLLGLRVGADMIRSQAEEARVCGVFEIRDSFVAGEVAAVLDQEITAGDPLLLTRRLFSSGRSSVSVNGQPATAAMVRQIGQHLVDIHGQHDHQYLLKPSHQLQILDAFAHGEDLRQRFGEVLSSWRQLQQQEKELAASRTLRRQQLELYEFQADEIDAADGQVGEFPELQARHHVLSNLKRIKKDATHANAALYEAEGSVIERLQVITHLLLELADLDESLNPTAEQVREATLSLQEASFELGRYVDRLEDDPGELVEVEDRLNTLNRLIQKYGDGSASAAELSESTLTDEDPLATVLAYRQYIGARIDELRSQNEGLAGITQKIAVAKTQLLAIGRQLTELRTAAAAKLRPLIEGQLKELGMADAHFEVGFESMILDDARISSSGLDAVEMLVQTNPGQEPRPLRKIASGGELSRIMLAIKSILASSDRVSVLVFDEIDANIGGRLGAVIGRKLRDLAVGSAAKTRGKKKNAPATGADAGHQILCITHLPQIAAFADQHLRIVKSVTGKGGSKQTRTTVAAIAGQERIEELAEMMAGKQATDTTRKQARELIADAAQ
jgi:DNA repair protein RecN (Recombination protein N)